MIRPRLRYRDLVALRIVNNRTTLNKRIKQDGFPPGAMTGPNERTWGEDEVEDYIASRPKGLKPVPQQGRPRPAGAGRRRKAETTATG
jgi:predicted DNA-binding transcriptional regulator AlpA